MHDFFKYVRDCLSNRGIARFYPSFMKEVSCYEKYIDSHPDVQATNRVSTQEYFVAKIIVPEFGHFSLIWDVSKILKDLPMYSLQPVSVPIASELVYYDPSNVSQERVMQYAMHPTKQPILLVWIEFIQKYYVIDGNHRCTACRMSNVDMIKGIILPAQVHLKYMTTDESRQRYKIFHNIAIMSNIANHPRCVVSETGNERDALYPITNNKLKISLFRHFCLRIYWLLTPRRMRLQA